MSNVKKVILSLFLSVCLNLPALSMAQTQAPRIALLDSGATGYVDRVISFTSLAADQDPLNHGTIVAKLVRQGNPHAKIFMLQVCENIDGQWKPSPRAVIAALQWVIQNNIDIVNLSLVLGKNPKIDALIKEATLQHGTIFVAAAGNPTLNSHFAFDTKGLVYRASRSRDVSTAFPSSNPYVISVGSLKTRGKQSSQKKVCDIYANGKAGRQEGSSFACARITARIIELFSTFPDHRKENILAAL